MKSVNQIIKWTLPITFSLTIICFAVLLSLSFKGLYYWDISHLSIAEESDRSEQQIKENYDVLIEYLTDENVDKLELPSFKMSEAGEIHFVDVKAIFMFLKKAMYVLGVYSMIGIIFNIMKKQYSFLKHTAVGTIAVPLGILLAVMINFDKAFVFFHHIAFTNDYWIFDPDLDPIITILPQEFFLHSFLLIISLVLIMALILIMIHKMEEKLWQQ
ncbi:MAG TPA: TIGR01906 family membrane protein [Epulopiscium sp.]|nr:TIGR01906 family membrane protein [Candidatus Epulonipiscium sp.]